MNNFTISQPTLPIQLTPFWGRELELAGIRRLLTAPTCRLLTLLGPGGIGKTRLALEAASEQGMNFNDGLCFVPLQPLGAADQMVLAIAETLNLSFFSSSEPKTQLLDYLSNKRLLLVLDNLEHLLEGVALVSDILAAAPLVKVIVTSRERLNLREEWLFDVGGLRFPLDETDPEAEAYSAVKLFTQNARRVRPDFGLNGDRAAVVRICQLVGGMPLGIELAASWTRTLSCDQIAQQITHGLDILATPTRNMPERHRSMRAVIDESWHMLTEAEAGIVSRLSVFRGGFTIAAAEAVAGASLPILAALVDKSWLHFDAEGGRYDVHELMRQYGAEQLERRNEGESTRAAHSTYFAGFMRQREKDIKFRRQIAALDEIEADFNNIRLAWIWAIQTDNRPAIDQMIEALSFFSDMRARWLEGIDLMTAAVEALASQEDMIWSRVRVRRVRLMMLGYARENPNENIQMQLEAHIAMGRAHDAPAEVAYGLQQLTMLTMWALNWKQASTYGEMSFNLLCDLNDRFYMGQMLIWIALMLGNTAATHQHLTVAKGMALHSLELSREVGDKNEIAWTAFHVGVMSYNLHEYAEGDRYFQEGDSCQRECRSMKALGHSLVQRAELALWIGEFERAQVMAAEAFQIVQYWNIAAIEDMTRVWTGLAKIMIEDYEGGEPLCRHVAVWIDQDIASFSSRVAQLGVAMAAFHAGNYTNLDQCYQNLVEDQQKISLISIQLYRMWRFMAPIGILVLSGRKRYEDAVILLSRLINLPFRTEYPSLAWLEKAPLFVRLRTQLEAKLGQQAFNDVWERGKTLDLEMTGAALLNGFPDSFTSLTDSLIPSVPETHHLLTAREVEVLGLVAAGLSNAQIAQQLFLSTGTVKWYVSDIFSKLNVNSRTQAVARARELKLIP